MGIQDFDELNSLVNDFVKKRLIEDANQGKRPEEDDDLIDLALMLMLDWYERGVVEANDNLGTAYESDSTKKNVIYENIAGKNFEDRVREHAAEYDVAGIMLVVTTECHRVYNAAIQHVAELYEDDNGVSIGKKWFTMEDEKVRDTHSYLHGKSVGRDDYFYTFDNDAARFPGDFTAPANNCNCRCWIKLEKI